VLVLPTIIAARRKIVAARLTTLRVRELSTRCPLILLLGLNPTDCSTPLSTTQLRIRMAISLFSAARMT